MTNVIVLGIVGAFIILLAAAYMQSRKTREELISEMEEEILSDEPAPVEAPAPVVAEVDPTPVAVEEVAVAPAPVEPVTPTPVAVKEVKAEVKEMVAAQEAPVEKPKPKRKRPAKKKPAQS
jgi:cell division septation protein DedD